MTIRLAREIAGVLIALSLSNMILDEVAAEKIEARSLKRVSGAAEAATSESEEVSKALGLFKEGRVEEALQTLRPYSSQSPDVIPAEVFIAQWFGQAKQARLARTWLEQATRTVPMDPEAYVVLGNMNVSEQRWTEAGLLFDKATELKRFVAGSKRELPTQLRILAGRAAIAQATGDWDTAEKCLEELVARQSEPSESVWQMLGRVLFRQGRATEALEKLQRAAEMNEDMPTPEVVLAGWCQQSDDLENMEKWLEIAIEKAGDDVPTRLAAATTLLRGERFDAALEQAEAALQIDPQSFEANLLRGNVTLLLEDHQSAVQFLEKAAMQSPGSFPATNNLALALCEGDSSQQERALQYAQMNTQRFPKQPGAIGTLGWVLFRLGRTEEAESVLRRAIESGYRSRELSYYWARMLADRGETSEAKSLLQSALEGNVPFFGHGSAEKLLERLEGQSE